MAVSKKAGSVDQVVVKSVEDAERYLQEMETIQEEIAPKMARHTTTVTARWRQRRS